jgi:hypothetical protein
MTRAWMLLAATMAISVPGVRAATPQASPNATASPIVVAAYMRAVPSSSSAIRCRRVCVKSGRGSPTHPPVCLQWRLVC